MGEAIVLNQQSPLGAAADAAEGYVQAKRQKQADLQAEAQLDMQRRQQQMEQQRVDEQSRMDTAAIHSEEIHDKIDTDNAAYLESVRPLMKQALELQNKAAQGQITQQDLMNKMALLQLKGKQEEDAYFKKLYGHGADTVMAQTQLKQLNQQIQSEAASIAQGWARVGIEGQQAATAAREANAQINYTKALTHGRNVETNILQSGGTGTTAQREQIKQAQAMIPYYESMFQDLKSGSSGKPPMSESEIEQQIITAKSIPESIKPELIKRLRAGGIATPGTSPNPLTAPWANPQSGGPM